MVVFIGNSGANITLRATYENETAGISDVINVAGGQTGDFAIIFSWMDNNVTPSTVSGWTTGPSIILDASGTTFDSTLVAHYKTLTGSEGSFFAFPISEDVFWQRALFFSGTGNYSTVTSGSINTTTWSSGGEATAQSLAMNGITAPLIGFACGAVFQETTDRNSNVTSNVGFDATYKDYTELSIKHVNLATGYKIYNSSPATHSIGTSFFDATAGSQKMLMSFYLRFS